MAMPIEAATFPAVAGVAAATAGEEGKNAEEGASSKEGSGARQINGFSIEGPEGAEALACSPECIAPFSMPSEALTYKPPANLVVSRFDNGDKERSIHCHTQLEAAEQERLAELQEKARLQGLRFPPAVAAAATRFLSHARLDVKKALKSMQSTQEWRSTYFKDGPIAADSIMDDLQHGIAYFAGRDCQLRPALVVRGSRIPVQWYKQKRVDRLIRVLIFCMEYVVRYMLFPGRVESLCVIVDLKGIGYGQVNISALSEVHKVMNHQYPGRVYRFYVANMPSALGMVAGFAKALLSDRQKQKLIVLRDVSELRQHFAPHQLEEDLGGSTAVATRFLPFPLQAGPFDVSCKSGPDPNAVRGVHRALTWRASLGHVWDPQMSQEQNLTVEYSSCAPEIFRQCGLGPSQEEGNAAAKAEEEAAAGRRTSQEEEATGSAAVVIVEPNLPGHKLREKSAEEPDLSCKHELSTVQGTLSPSPHSGDSYIDWEVSPENATNSGGDTGRKKDAPPSPLLTGDDKVVHDSEEEAGEVPMKDHAKQGCLYGGGCSIC